MRDRETQNKGLKFKLLDDILENRGRDVTISRKKCAIWILLSVKLRVFQFPLFHPKVSTENIVAYTSVPVPGPPIPALLSYPGDGLP